MKDYKELLVWQKAVSLTTQIYTMTRGFPSGQALTGLAGYGIMQKQAGAGERIVWSESDEKYGWA